MTRTKEDDDGIVRTVHVEFRLRHASDIGKAYVSKTPTEMEIGTQRFAVLLAVDEETVDQGKDPRLPGQRGG